jgi:hypothetical protein
MVCIVKYQQFSIPVIQLQDMNAGNLANDDTAMTCCIPLRMPRAFSGLTTAPSMIESKIRNVEQVRNCEPEKRIRHWETHHHKSRQERPTPGAHFFIF